MKQKYTVFGTRHTDHQSECISISLSINKHPLLNTIKYYRGFTTHTQHNKTSGSKNKASRLEQIKTFLMVQHHQVKGKKILANLVRVSFGMGILVRLLYLPSTMAHTVLAHSSTYYSPLKRDNIFLNVWPFDATSTQPSMNGQCYISSLKYHGCLSLRIIIINAPQLCWQNNTALLYGEKAYTSAASISIRVAIFVKANPHQVQKLHLSIMYIFSGPHNQ